MMPWLHYTDFRGAHSPFNTVHKWARGGLIEWVCGFLLTLQGPLQPTPARKQIKLQFHHLEGAVSCPNAALSLHPPSTYTHKTLHLRLIRAAQLPRPQNASLFPLLNCREEWRDLREERGKEGDGWLRGKGDWEHARGSYCSFIPVKYFAVEKAQGERDRKATLLWHLDSERPQTPTEPSMPLWQ